jgi:hypothetical protein
MVALHKQMFELSLDELVEQLNIRKAYRPRAQEPMSLKILLRMRRFVRISSSSSHPHTLALSDITMSQYIEAILIITTFA